MPPLGHYPFIRLPGERRQGDSKQSNSHNGLFITLPISTQPVLLFIWQPDAFEKALTKLTKYLIILLDFFFSELRRKLITSIGSATTLKARRSCYKKLELCQLVRVETKYRRRGTSSN